MSPASPRPVSRSRPTLAISIAVLFALIAALAAGASAGAADSCVAKAGSATDDQGRTFTTLYYCSTYVGSAVYANPFDSKPLDDSGYMNQAAEVWVICQRQGRANPVIQGNTNTWWLYTQGDTARANAYGYTGGWGYLPATAVSQGGQNQAVPGVPTCPASPPTSTPPPPPPPPAPGVPPAPGTTCTDCDADGFPAAVDCDDASAAIHPGATDVPGNAIDEDCDGTPEPFPRLESSVGYSFKLSRGYTVLSALHVRSARAGSTIRVSCSGRGCAFRVRTRSVTANARSVSLSRLVRRARLRPGAKLEIRVTKPATIGVVRRLSIRSRTRPTQLELCIAPGAARPTRCVL